MTLYVGKESFLRHVFGLKEFQKKMEHKDLALEYFYLQKLKFIISMVQMRLRHIYCLRLVPF